MVGSLVRFLLTCCEESQIKIVRTHQPWSNLYIQYTVGLPLPRYTDTFCIVSFLMKPRVNYQRTSSPFLVHVKPGLIYCGKNACSSVSKFPAILSPGLTRWVLKFVVSVFWYLLLFQYTNQPNFGKVVNGAILKWTKSTLQWYKQSIVWVTAALSLLCLLWHQ